MSVLSNPEFFKKKTVNTKKEIQPKENKPATAVKSDTAPKMSGTDEAVDVSLNVSGKLITAMDRAIKFFKEAKLNRFAAEVETIKKETLRQRFTVAVVGEFSRGKSTFVNNMFRRNLLPVANMPTTAMLTRIRYSEKEAIAIFDATLKNKKLLPLCEESWENYVADDSGNDPNGVAFVGIDSPWLKSGIEIIDTPGAGDLEEKRSLIIGDALKGSDSAIITISAEAAMSMSEKLFIEERLIAKKTPFLMLIITKLDRIALEQRNSVIAFVKEKLELWNMNNIPVYVPYNVELPDSKYSAITGMDKVIGQINSWITGSDRKKITEEWITLKLENVFSSAESFIGEQRCLAQAENEEKRKEMLEEKKRLIDKAQQVWEETKNEMIKKGDACYDSFLSKAEGYKASITEKLQYEVMHASNLKKWWESDYPYRLKIEMTNMSSSVENLISRTVSKDVTWFNNILEKNFKTCVLFNSEETSDKEAYTNFAVSSDVALKDTTVEKNISKIGIAALSVTAALLCASVGVTSLIGTMGISTGGSILTDSFFRKKSDAQKELLKEELRKDVPRVVTNAMVHSENRIKNIYVDIIKDAGKKQKEWYDNQCEMIKSGANNDKFKDTSAFIDLLNKLDEFSTEIKDYLS